MLSRIEFKIQRWIGLRPWQRHGLVLMLGSLIYISVGLSMMFPSARQELQFQRSLEIALQVFPLATWAFIFVMLGLAALTSSRWPSFGSESWGYSILTGLSTGWAAVHIMGFFVGGPRSNLVAGFIWTIAAAMWWAISGLVNPPKSPLDRAETIRTAGQKARNEGES